MSTQPIVRSRFTNPRIINNGQTLKVDAEFKADQQWPGKRLFAMNLRFMYDSATFKWGTNDVKVVDFVPTWRLGTDSFPLTIKPQRSTNVAMAQSWFGMTSGVVYVNTNVQGEIYNDPAAAAGVPTLDNWARYFSLELNFMTPVGAGATVYPVLIWDKTKYDPVTKNRGIIAGDGLTQSLVINPDGQYVDEQETIHLNWDYTGTGQKAPFGAPNQANPVTRS